MEKILSKSRSRYFFGKKKGLKNQGISSSDPPVAGPEGNGKNFGAVAPSITPQATPRMFPGGASVMMISGPQLPHAGPSNPVADRTVFQTDSPEIPSSTATRSVHHGTSSPSRFEVHISPTTFSPIMIPSSTPPHMGDSPSASPSKRHGFLPLHSKDIEVGAALAPRTGTAAAHTRSQSTATGTPDQTSSARTKLRRHGIHADFMGNVGVTTRETHAWNGQSLGAERFMANHTLRDASSSSFSRDPVLVRPSASAPATSCLANTDTGAGTAAPELAPLRESSTIPSMPHSSFPLEAHASLPRSGPSYNLAALTPSSSRTSAPRRAPGVELRPSSGAHRGPPPPLHPDVDPCLHRAPSQLPSPPSPVSQSEASSTAFRLPPGHHSNLSVNSETEIGYKGLAFPLPPSSEEGLAVSYSSSQTSLFSVGSERKSGEHPNSPKKTREIMHRGHEARDARTSRSTGSHATALSSGRGARDRCINVSAGDGRTSPTPSLGTPRKRQERLARPSLGQSVGSTSGTDTDKEWGTIRNVNARVANEQEDTLSVNTEEDDLMNGTFLAVQSLATSEANRTPALRPQTQTPKFSGPTKPLSLAGRKTLLTMRSVATGLGERKQIHASASHRDLSASFQSVNGGEERVRTVTVAPTGTGTGLSRDREVPGSISVTPSLPLHHANPPLPPTATLPTPPSSSSALSFLAGETKSSALPPPRPIFQPGPVPRPTLEDVTSALRTQRVRFDELAGHVLDVAQQHAAEQHAYAGRVGRLEGALAKMEREICGLRWLVLEHAKGGGNDGAEKRLRRSSTMPHLPTLSPPENGRGLGLEFSPDSAVSSRSMLSPTPPVLSRLPHVEEAEVGERTPSMDDIIDKLMAVRQWASADVRVSVVEGLGVGAREGGNSKRIVFR